MEATASQDTRQQVIVRFSNKTEQQINDKLTEWETKGVRIKDSSINPQNLYLLECEKEIADELIKDDSIKLYPLPGIQVRINGGQDNNSRNVEIDSGGNFGIFLNYDKMPPIANSYTDFKGDLLENIFNNVFDSEVTIYVLDTGCVPKSTNSTPEPEDDWNPDNLMIRVKDDKSDKYRNYGYNYTPDNHSANKDVSNDFKDEHGHGTFGIKAISEAIPRDKLKIVPLKIFNKHGKGTFFDMICAIYQAIEDKNKADIINLSAGFRQCIECGVPSILTDVIRAAEEKGIFIVASAGNGFIKLSKEGKIQKGINLDETFEKHLPASIQGDNMISVASLGKNDVRSKFSNYGKNISLATYGENIPNRSNEEMPSGTSVAAFYTTKALAAVISKYKEEYEHKYKDKKVYLKKMRGKFDEIMEDSKKNTEAEVTAKKYLKFGVFFSKLDSQQDVEPVAVVSNNGINGII